MGTESPESPSCGRSNFWDTSLLKCLSSGQLVDVTFTFPNETNDDLDNSSKGVSAHRLLLSLASPVFKVLLDPQSKFQATTEITDMTESAFRLLIECIYSAPDESGFRRLDTRVISLDDFVGVFYGVKKYQVDHLRPAFVQLFQLLCIPAYVLRSYGKIRHWADEDELKANCIREIQRRFLFLEWSEEHLEIFQELISRNDLTVPEIGLFVLSLKLARMCADDPIQILRGRGILANIRFPLMSQQEVMEDVWPTGVLTMEELVKVLKRISGEMIDCGFSAHPRFDPSGREFQYESDFDQKGIIYHLGLKAGQALGVWQNPHGVHLTVHASSVHCLNHQVTVLTSRSLTEKFWTMNKQDSWIEIDFGSSQSLVPTAYTLRHGFDKARDGIRNWVLEGSNDQEFYDILRCHSNDTHLGNAPFDTHTWSLQNPRGQKYRYLRLRQIGKGASDDPKFKHQFTISGVEFYGWLVRTEASTLAGVTGLVSQPNLT